MNGFFKVESDFISLIADIGIAATVIYFVLLSHCNDDRICWPSMKRLATLSGLAMNTVRRALDTLKDNGMIEIKQRTADNGTCLPNVFYLPPISHPAKFNRVPSQNEQGTLPNLIGVPCQIEQGDPAKTENLTICKKEINITRRSKAAYEVSEIPIPESLRKPRQCPKCAQITYDNTDLVCRDCNTVLPRSFLVAWQDWQKYRREIKKTLAPSTAEAQLKKLASMGTVKAIETIDCAIEKGWTGLYEPGGNGNGQTPAAAKPPAKVRYFETRKTNEQ